MERFGNLNKKNNNFQYIKRNSAPQNKNDNGNKYKYNFVKLFFKNNEQNDFNIRNIRNYSPKEIMKKNKFNLFIEKKQSINKKNKLFNNNNPPIKKTKNKNKLEQYKKILQWNNKINIQNQNKIIVIVDQKIINSTSVKKLNPQNNNNNNINENNINKNINNNNNNNIFNNKEKNSNVKENPLNLDYCYKEDANKLCREKMEDHYKINLTLSSFPKISYFSIFDGHSGDEVSKYCELNFDKILKKELKETKNNIEKSLINTFEKIDKEILKQNYSKETGSTASILLIYEKNNNKYFAFANVGDSKCYLIKKNNIIQISKDHNCKDKLEVERIKQKGGLIFNERVFGSLILTRSIGDKEMKNYGVINLPFILIDQIQNDDLFFVIASDGVWDVINQEELFNIVNNNIYTSQICECIIKKSIDYGTSDNVSCIVVKI